MKIAKKIFLLGNTPVKDVFIQHLLVTDVSFELIEIKMPLLQHVLQISKTFFECSNCLKHWSNRAVPDRNITES